MSKPTHIQINIPKPCNQPWEEMTPCGQGRFCNHCQKTVIDFTTWGDAAMYRFFSENTGKVCGRFLSTQTSRPIYIPPQPHSRLYRMTIALGLTLMFTQAPDVIAQNKPPKVVQTTTRQTTRKHDTANIPPMQVNSTLPLNTIRGEAPRDTSRKTVLTGEPESKWWSTSAPPILGKAKHPIIIKPVCRPLESKTTATKTITFAKMDTTAIPEKLNDSKYKKKSKKHYRK